MANIPFSPTALESYRDAPVTTLLNRFVLKRDEPVVRYGTSMVGTELHQYAEDSFKYLQSKKSTFPDNPSNSFIKQTLFEAQERAKSALSLHTSRHMKKGIDSIVERHGSEYIKNKSMTMFSEQTLTHSVSSGITGETGKLTGIPDVVFYDAAKKKATIVDLKNVFDRGVMATFDNADKKLQAKSYPYLVAQELIKNGVQVDSIEFQFAMNPAYGPVGYKSFEYATDKIMADVKTDLAMETAKAENLNLMMTNRLGQGESAISAFRGAFAEIINKRGCMPGKACPYCPMQYSCHLRFAERIGDKLQAFNEDPTITTTKRDQIRQSLKGKGEIYDDFLAFEAAEKMDKDNVDFFMNRHDNQMSEAITGHYEKQVERFQDLGMHPYQAADFAKNDIAVLNQSAKVERRFKRGLFEDSYLDDSILSEGKLPVSVLDHDRRTTHAWMNENLLRAVKSVSYDTVDKVMKNLDINRPAMTERVINKLFSNKKFVNDFNENLQWSAAKQMREKGLNPTYQNARDVLGNLDKILDVNTVTHLTENLHKATIDEVWRTDAESLRRKLPADVEFTRSNYDAVFNAAKSKGILDAKPEELRTKIADMDTAWGKNERFSLSAPKGMLSTMVKAFVLTNIAANETILNIVQNKVMKAINYMASEEQGVPDTGDHNSTYGTMRRLILSDFGSSTRLYNGVGGIYSAIAAKGSTALKAAKEKAADFFMKRESSLVNPEWMATGGDNYIYGGVAAAAGIALYALAPRSPSYSEQKKYGQAKKKELKKKREVSRSKDSHYPQQQSDLREKLKIHGQFGSPFIDKVGLVLQKIDLSEVGEYLGKLADGTMALTSKLFSHSEERVATIKLLGKRMEKLAEGVMDNPVDTLKKAGREIGSKAANLDQYITEKKVGVVAKERVSEMAKAGYDKVMSIDARKAMEKAGEKVGPDTLLNASVSHITKKNAMPVIVKQASKTQRHLASINRQESNNSHEYPISSTGGPREMQYYEATLRGNTSASNEPVITRSMRGENLIDTSTINRIMTNKFVNGGFPERAVIGRTSPNMVPPDPGSTDFTSRKRKPITMESGVGNTTSDKMSMIADADATGKRAMAYKNKGPKYGGDRPWDESVRYLMGGY